MFPVGARNLECSYRLCIPSYRAAVFAVRVTVAPARTEDSIARLLNQKRPRRDVVRGYGVKSQQMRDT